MQSFITLALITAILTVMFAWNIQRRFPDGSYLFFVLTMLSAMSWSLFAILEIVADTEAWKLVWAGLQYIGIGSLPLCWFFFSCEFSERRNFIRKDWRMLIWLEPILILALVATNPYHHLFWVKIEPAPPIDGFQMLSYHKGFLFVAHAVFSYGLILSGTTLIQLHLFQKKQFVRQLYVSLGLLAPVVSNLLYLNGLMPIDYTSAAFSLTCISFAWAIISADMEQRQQMMKAVLQNEKLAGIGQLAAGIAHEINNPLGFTKSNLSTMQKYVNRLTGLLNLYEKLEGDQGTLSEAQRETRQAEILQYRAANRIQYILEDFPQLNQETLEGVTRIEKIIRSLRGYTQDDLPSASSDLDLNEAINDLLPLVESEWASTVRIRVEMEPLPPIRVERQDIVRILLNLITNAIQAIRESGGDGTVIIRTGFLSPHVFCEVCDNGTGIEPRHLVRVFEPFFTTRAIGSGSGLGLSLARDLVVNKYHGDLSVKSVWGEGSTFRLVFPAGVTDSARNDMAGRGGGHEP